MAVPSVPGSINGGKLEGRISTGGQGGQARTRLARAAVVQAARTLFRDRGYATTTIGALSDLADVPTATVYRLFSSKLGILRALLDVSIAGDDEAVPLQDRANARALFADPDPERQLSGFAGVCRETRKGGKRAKGRSRGPWPVRASYGRS